MKLWGGRFAQEANENLRRLNDSIGYDRRMYAEDIQGSIAYAEALASAGVISVGESEQIVAGLEKVKAEFDDGSFRIADGDEDIHTAVERRLTEIVGAVGGKLHTGRSRNDQVATDFRLWTMQAIDRIDALIERLQAAIIEQAEPHTETIMPGYTHLQPAQPVTAAHWLMSFFWMLLRDRDRLRDARQRMAVLPLGAGALAGTPFPVDRQKITEKLGFNSYSHNSLDAVSDRDFVIETIFTFALLGSHLSRLAEDVIIYSNPAFGFITLDDRYSTGSSLMPQKRNADPMELTRGKAGRLNGQLAGLMTTLKGLPSGYNKDLQEDKESLFDAFDTLNDLLPVVTGVIATLQLNRANMRAALQDEMLATDLADYLVEKGMPFREAHHVIGQVVQFCSENDLTLTQLTTEQLRQISELFTEDVHTMLSFEQSVAKRRTAGGTAPDAVREQIKQAKKYMG
jgi:argininosuccinate lyase